MKTFKIIVSLALLMFLGGISTVQAQEAPVPEQKQWHLEVGIPVTIINEEWGMRSDYYTIGIMVVQTGNEISGYGTNEWNGDILSLAGSVDQDSVNFGIHILSQAGSPSSGRRGVLDGADVQFMGTITGNTVEGTVLPGSFTYQYWCSARGEWLLETQGWEQVPFSGMIQQLALPDLAVTSLNHPEIAGNSIILSYTIENQGTATTTALSPWSDAVYLSSDNVLDVNDSILDRYLWSESLGPGESRAISISVALLPNIALDNHYLIIKTDFSENINESDEQNNTLSVLLVLPDLVVTGADAPFSASAQQQIVVSWTVKNQGLGRELGSWVDGLYLSTNDQFDDADIHLATTPHSGPLFADETYTSVVSAALPNLPLGNYYLLVKTDRNNQAREAREWNNVFPIPLTIVEVGQESGFSETFSNQSTMDATILSQKFSLADGTVVGDLNGTFDLNKFEIVAVHNEAFTDTGFSKAEWTIKFEDISYQGVSELTNFYVLSERKVYLKGAIMGGEASGIVEGYLTESVPESNVFDKYHAAWKFSRLGGLPVSTSLTLDGTLTNLEEPQELSTKIYVLQTSVQGNTFGHYIEDLSVVLTHARVADETNPYNGQGFCIISYVSKIGSGQGWAYAKVVSPGVVMLNGLFTGPLMGMVSGVLNESASPKTITLNVERVDLALFPAVDLKVKVWGPERISPGQTINYIIEYRNDGLEEAENVFVIMKLPSAVALKYVQNTGRALYNDEFGEIVWRLAKVAPMSIGYLSTTVTVPWGLEARTMIDQTVYIPTEMVEIYTDPTADVNFAVIEESDSYAKIAGEVFNSITSEPFNLELSVAEVAEEMEPTIEIVETPEGATEYNLTFTVEGHSTDKVTLKMNIANKGFELAETVPKVAKAVRIKNEQQWFLDKLLQDGLITARTHKNYSDFNKIGPIIPIARYGISQAKWIGWIDQFLFNIGFIVANTQLWNAVKIEIWQIQINQGRCIGANTLDKVYSCYKKEQAVAASLTTGITDQGHDPNIKYGPEGNVLSGQKLDYKVEYENEGEGIAFGVYFTDTLDEDLDDSTLEIGPVFDVQTEVQIGEPGIYNPKTRTITWFTGEVGSGQGGYAEFNVNAKNDLPDGTEIINFATVYFPSVPEVTRTNGIVSIINLNQPPVAEAGGPYQGNEGSPMTLDGSQSSDPDGDILQYRWDFNNDGVWDTEWLVASSTNYTWADDYAGIVKLEVSDGKLFTTDSASVIVNNVAPTVEVGPDQEVVAGDAVQFNGSFTDPGVYDTPTISWDFGDGSTASGTLTPTHAYYQKGAYTVTLTVIDDDGGTGIDTLQILIKPIPATINCDPNTLNLKSNGQWITCYIELPASYNVKAIDGSAVSLNGIAAYLGKEGWAKKEANNSNIMDSDGDGILERMVKFNRAAIQAVLPPGEAVTLTLSGKLLYNTGLADLEGKDTIKVIK